MLIEFDINICDEKQKVENDFYVCDIFIHSGICPTALHSELFIELDVVNCITLYYA